MADDDNVHQFMEYRKRAEDREKELAKQTPLEGGGGGDHTGGMEARVAKLEAHVEHIDKTISDIKADVRDLRNTVDGNFKWMLGLGFTAWLALILAAAKGFNWI